MNVTTLPVGATGQFLEGVAVSTGVRESVILTSPTDPQGFAEVTSTQPIAMYGLPVWVQGAAGTSQVFGTVSSQIVSSIPFYVAQSSSPWTMNGGLAVTNSPNVNVTNVPAVNITTSIPFFVAQSSAPWTINGSLNVSSQSAVSSSFPIGTTSTQIVSSIPFFVAQSSGPWSVLGTTTPNIVSSIPFFVAQSSAPWSFVETVSTAGGMSVTTIALQGNLNTTVVKASAGQVYAISGSNVGSSNVFVRMLNVSTAATAIASTGAAILNFGLPVSTSPYNNYDCGVPFSAGITLLTQQQPYLATTSIAPTASTATITIFYK